MNMLRITGLLCAAFMMMGSGGIAKKTEAQTPATVLEPEYVDEGQAADAAAAAVDETDEALADASLDAAASDGAGGKGDAIPATAVEMAEGGKAVEISLSDDYIQGRYYTGGGILGFDDAIGHLGLYISDNRDLIGNVGLMTDRVPLLKGVEGLEGLTLSAGVRGYLALLADPADDVIGVAPGIEGRYGLPYEIGFPLAVVGNIFYSPDILTLGDAENIIDIDIRAEAEVIPEIVGFIGYREFRFDSDEGSDKEAASEIQVGARFAL